MNSPLKNIIFSFVFITSFGILSVKGQGCILALESGYPIITTPRCSTPDGSIEVLASGTGAITYQLNSSPPQSNGLFSDLSTGTYVITVRDEDDCELVLTIPLEGQQNIEILNVDTTDSDCDAPTGTATINAEGVNLTYSLSNNAYQESNVFTGLSGGIYTAYVKDANECIETIEFTIIQGSINLISESVVNTNCHESNGQIHIEATGDSLEYMLDGVTGWQSSSSFSGLQPGSYTVQIRDSSGCILTESFLIRNNLDYTIIPTLPLCNENNGAIEIQVHTPGVYEYSIDDGETYQSENYFGNLAVGTYLVRIRLVGTDCFVNRRVIIVVDPEITVENFDVVQPICSNNTGSIDIDAVGDGLVFTITNDDGFSETNTTGEFFDLYAGIYQVTISNSEGCSITNTYNLQALNDIVIEGIPTTPTYCTTPEGTLLIQASSNLGNELLYSFNGGDFSTQTFFENLYPGSYEIIVQSTTGCQRTENATVPSYDPIIVTSLPTSIPSSACSEDGSITVIATGGGALEYSLDNINWQDEHIFSNLNPGVYVVYIRAENGCTYNTGDITLPTNFEIDGVETQNVFCDRPEGEATISARGTQLDYKVDDGEYQSDPTFTGLAVGTHTVYVRDLFDCVLQAEFEITSQGGVEFIDYEINFPTCEDVNAEITLFASTIGDSLEYWQEGGEPSPSPVFYPFDIGTYKFYARDNFGCVDSIDVTVTETSAVVHQVSTIDYICFQHPGSITVTHEGGLRPFSYSLDNITYQRSNTFNNLSDGLYTVYMLDRNGCPSTIEAEVGYQCEPLIPNAITPDGNGINDRLVLLHERNLKINEFRVYNGWGELVYERHDFWSLENTDMFWDGIDHEQENGDQNVFLYFVSFQDIDDTTRKMEGVVHLVR